MYAVGAHDHLGAIMPAVGHHDQVVRVPNHLDHADLLDRRHVAVLDRLKQQTVEIAALDDALRAAVLRKVERGFAVDQPHVMHRGVLKVERDVEI